MNREIPEYLKDEWQTVKDEYKVKTTTYITITKFEYEKLKQENQQLKEQLHQASMDIQEMVESDVMCPTNCDKLIKYKSVLDEIREKIDFAKATIEYSGDYSDVDYNFLISADKIVEILDKVKE